VEAVVVLAQMSDLMPSIRTAPKTSFFHFLIYFFPHQTTCGWLKNGLAYKASSKVFQERDDIEE
jgi:hypothetical protein